MINSFKVLYLIKGVFRQYHWPWITLILLIAFLLRTYRLGSQSISLDEYLFVGLLPASSLKMHLIMARVLVPELCVSPFYFVLQYLWNLLAEGSIEILRLLPVTISLVGIPIAYYLGLMAGGRFPAVMAALLLSISPQHIWYAQELRPYGLMTVLILFSIFCLLKADYGGSHYWLMNGLVNAMVLWVYALGGLIFLVEGLYLLIFSRRKKYVCVKWTVGQLFIIIPWAFWAFQLPFAHSFSLDPSIREIINSIFLDDIVSCHNDLMPDWKTCADTYLPLYTKMLLSSRRIADFILALFLFSGALFGCWNVIRTLWQSYINRINDFLVFRKGEIMGAMFLTLFVPGCFLGLLEYFFRRPFLGSMYIMYGNVALYILIGVMLFSIKHIKTRWCLAGIVVIMFGFQCIVFVPGTTRTDYHGAAAYLKGNAQQGDKIMCFQWLAPEDCLGLYLGGRFGPVQRITTLQGACDAAYSYFGSISESNRIDTTVWFALPRFLLDMMHDTKSLTGFKDGLRERGMVCSSRLFPGQYNLEIFRINVASVRLPLGPFSQIRMPFSYDEDGLLQSLKLNIPGDERRTQVLYVLRSHVFAWPPIGSFFPMMESLDLLSAQEIELAEAMAAYSITTYPSFGMSYYVAGLSAAIMGDTVKAESHFKKAFALQPGLALLVGDYSVALLRGDSLKAYACLKQLKEQGDIYLITPMTVACEMIAETDQ